LRDAFGAESIVLNGAGCVPWDVIIAGENEKGAALSRPTHLWNVTSIWVPLLRRIPSPPPKTETPTYKAWGLFPHHRKSLVISGRESCCSSFARICAQTNRDNVPVRTAVIRRRGG